MAFLSQVFGLFGWSTYVISFIALGVFYFFNTKSKRGRFAPGPIPLPIVGNALEILGRPLHETFLMMQKQYGDIFSLKVANVEVVVINGYENIRDALLTNGKKFLARPNITWTSLTQHRGIFSQNEPDYHRQKNVIISILGDVAWDKKELAELRIQQNGADLITWLREQAGKPVNPQIFLDAAVCNVTSAPVIGIAFKPTDDLMIALSKIAMDIFVDAGAQNVNNYFTFLRNIPGDPTNYQVLIKNATTAMGVVKGVVEAHKEKLEKNPDAPREDFIDHYLDRISKGNDPTCTEQQLIAVVTDLVAMGIQATSTTLRWALLLLSKHKDVQERIQKEVDEVMRDSIPSLKHEQEMEYTHAVIAEVQRYINLVSINLPHATTELLTFQGYVIPAGTVIIPNLASVHYDEKTYPDPLSFKPDRFMESDGFHQPEKFMPYSCGARTCLGKNVSQWQLFIMLTTILQKFDVRLSGEVGEDIYGLIRYPGEFRVTFGERGSTIAGEASGIKEVKANGVIDVKEDNKVDEVKEDNKVDEVKGDIKVDEVKEYNKVDEVKEDIKVDEVKEDSEVTEFNEE